jgi:hypothetical protein
MWDVGETKPCVNTWNVEIYMQTFFLFFDILKSVLSTKEAYALGIKMACPLR